MKFIFRIYNRFFSKDKDFAKRLYSLVGFIPANLDVFKLAFYHKSTSTEKLYAIQSNERLEYLGDAVLGTIVAEYLFRKYPNSNEGFLTKMRSKIVKRSSLNKIADRMGLDVFLSEYNKTRLSRSMLGNALEALVGAVYLEVGYKRTRKYVINKILRGYLDIHKLESFDDNYKSQLLEHCQKNGQTVQYKMLTKYKYEKRDRFKVAVMIDGKKIATADDFNKKSAEQVASEKAMHILGLKTNGNDDDDKNKRNNSRSTYNNQRSKQKPKPKSAPKRSKPAASSAKSNTNNSTEQKPKEKPASTKKPRPKPKPKPKASTANNQKPKANDNNRKTDHQSSAQQNGHVNSNKQKNETADIDKKTATTNKNETSNKQEREAVKTAQKKTTSRNKRTPNKQKKEAVKTDQQQVSASNKSKSPKQQDDQEIKPDTKKSTPPNNKEVDTQAQHPPKSVPLSQENTNKETE